MPPPVPVHHGQRISKKEQQELTVVLCCLGIPMMIMFGVLAYVVIDSSTEERTVIVPVTSCFHSTSSKGGAGTWIRFVVEDRENSFRMSGTRPDTWRPGMRVAVRYAIGRISGDVILRHVWSAPNP